MVLFRPRKRFEIMREAQAEARAAEPEHPAQVVLAAAAAVPPAVAAEALQAAVDRMEADLPAEEAPAAVIRMMTLVLTSGVTATGMIIRIAPFLVRQMTLKMQIVL